MSLPMRENVPETPVPELGAEQETGPLKTIKVLLIEDSVAYADIIRRRLLIEQKPAFLVEHAGTLSQALGILSDQKPDIILLDLTLPDSRGLDTFLRVHLSALAVPIVVLTGWDDEMQGLQAVQKGAQDYLVKGRTHSRMLPRILRYALERSRMQAELLHMSLADDLTGLHNRRGFFALAEQHRKLAARNRESFLLIFLDLDGLKQINDRQGHRQGDQALADVALVLREVFRNSDIIGRIGGDEFAVLAIQARGESSAIVLGRLAAQLRNYNERPGAPYRLSLSSGVACFDPENPTPLEDLMAQADKGMYLDKEAKRRSPGGASTSA